VTPGLGARRGDDDAERGSASLFFVVALAAFLLLLGLVVDGGVKARALARADTLAAEAARAGAQAVDVPSVLAGRHPVVDPVRARATALAYLSGNGATGEVTVGDGGRKVTVDVTLTRPTAFLGLIGIHQLTVHGTATATLTVGIR